MEIKNLHDIMELVPVEGEAHVYAIKFKNLPSFTGEEMTETEWNAYWDKFEKDIEDSCERIP